MNIVVSGAASGIGLAIAEKFLREGHSVCGLDRNGSAIAHPAYRHFVCDIRDEKLPELPDTEILICCAGTQEERDAIAVNLTGTIHFTEHFRPCERLRSVLFIASASARNGAEFPLYVASKAGIVGYMKNLALAEAKRGVTVNSISPGGVITPANRHILEDEKLYRAVLDETLLGKWCEAEEIAELAYFLTVVNRSMTGDGRMSDIDELRSLAKMIQTSSLCGLGKTAPNPVLSTLQNFEEEYVEHIRDKRCHCGTCKALAQYVITDKCIGCTKCARNCPVNAITGTVRHQHVIDTTKCIKCGTCKANCPVGAIKEG